MSELFVLQVGRIKFFVIFLVKEHDPRPTSLVATFLAGVFSRRQGAIRFKYFLFEATFHAKDEINIPMYLIE